MEKSDLEFKRAAFAVLSEEVRRELEEAGLTEQEVLDDFELWRKTK